ncbi:beta-ketoacyl synthase N-terminal-like domain-containing protein [Nonomuraea recticatena]|uniref:beta-ketoacyl synthase N-terminal-like domain-containing protein n=1 Tax=Nonomuraea recticatena TaxID=46178 RepID=UPI003618FC4E
MVAERIGHAMEADDLFIDYGIGSSDAVALAGALEARLGVALPSTVLYDHPTPRALAGHLAGGANAREQRPAAGVHDPVAIVGIGCRLPGASGPRQLWHLLTDGVDAIGPVPGERAVRHPGWAEPGVGTGGFLADVDAFDPEFFAISAREAAAMDPQQRMLLEVAHEAFQDAGVRQADLGGSPTGVFVGISSSDFAVRALSGGAEPDGYTPTGVAHSVGANRISYVFDLHGPSMSIDTACSSSLVATHHAVTALRTGQCDLALAGGVNAVLSPDIALCFRTAGILAPDGRCKSFAAHADGMCRSEGAVMVILKRLSDALAGDDRIYAVIRGGAVNSDGRTNGLMSPSAPSQVRLLRAACAAAGVRPAEISYVEAHGSGTRLGDLMELRALSEVLGEGRAEPLRIGSAKSNLGHLEAAAGAAGLAKLALALFHRTLPRSLHARERAEEFDWDRGNLLVQTETEPWEGRLAGVSSFGFGGTNAHLILEAAPSREPVPARPGRHYLPLSAHTPAALRELAGRWRNALDDPDLATGEPLAAAVHTAGARRDHHACRFLVSGADAAELRRELDRAMVDLLAVPPAGARGGALALFFADTPELQPAVTGELLRAGIRPDLVIGHGRGDRRRTLPRSADPGGRGAGGRPPRQGARGTSLRARRARAPGAAPGRGSVPPRRSRRRAGRHRRPAHQSHRGSPAAAGRLTAALEGSQVRFSAAGPVAQRHGKPAVSAAAELKRALRGLETNVGEVAQVSTVTGEPVDGREQDPRYWAAHLAGPSLLAEALDHALRRGVTTFVEIGSDHLAPRLRAVAGERQAHVVRCATLTTSPVRWPGSTSWGTTPAGRRSIRRPDPRPYRCCPGRASGRRTPRRFPHEYRPARRGRLGEALSWRRRR